MKAFHFFFLNNDGLAGVQFSDLARLYEAQAGSMFAIQPSSNMDGSFDIEWQDSESALGISEQLYTARGSQSIGTNSAMTKQLFVD